MDTFFNRFNHDTNYKDGDTKLSLGNYITINDGTYNVAWEIAGFDMEHNQVAADGTVYDNGYGICMIPKTYVTSAPWHTSGSITLGYNNSSVHKTTLPDISSKLQNVLGSHIVNRNVLLSSKAYASSPYKASAYTWTTAYATLMSAGQMTGTFGSNSTIYDDGEANYKLPIFDTENYAQVSNIILRGIYGYSSTYYSYQCWIVATGQLSGTVIYHNGAKNYDIRPLIYLR